MLFKGGLNATALAKFTQQHEDSSHLKMALITKEQKFVHPQAYFGVSHGHLPGLKLISGTPAAQVENWSKINADC